MADCEIEKAETLSPRLIADFAIQGCETCERIEEALREIAVLFIALAPLDVFLGEGMPYAVRNGLIFIGVGLMMFLVALFVETKRSRG